MKASSIGFSVPSVSGLAARTNAQAAKAARKIISVTSASRRFCRSQAKICVLFSPRSAQPDKTASSSPAKTRLPWLLFKMPSEANSQKIYPHNSSPRARLAVYPRSGRAGSRRKVRGKTSQPSAAVSTYHRIAVESSATITLVVPKPSSWRGARSV